MKRSPPPELPEIKDEPGMAERFQRGLRRALRRDSDQIPNGILRAVCPGTRVTAS